MKRSPKFLPENLTLLDLTQLRLTLDDLVDMFEDEQGLISMVLGSHCPNDIIDLLPELNGTDDARHVHASTQQEEPTAKTREEDPNSTHLDKSIEKRPEVENEVPQSDEQPSTPNEAIKPELAPTESDNNDQDSRISQPVARAPLPNYIIYTDKDYCLYFIDGEGAQKTNPQTNVGFHFLDTTDLPDWQFILWYLHYELHGLNSLGDE